MRKLLLILTALGLGAIAYSVRAEKADTPPAGLAKTATHVVVGKVNAVYTRAAKDGQWRYTHYVAEVKVDKVEKGEGLKKGDLLYARYWRRSWTGGNPPPSTSGHRGLPEEGESLRIYLARNAYDGFTKDNDDGGFNVIGANGFERLPKDAD